MHLRTTHYQNNMYRGTYKRTSTSTAHCCTIDYLLLYQNDPFFYGLHCSDPSVDYGPAFIDTLRQSTLLDRYSHLTVQSSTFCVNYCRVLDLWNVPSSTYLFDTCTKVYSWFTQVQTIVQVPYASSTVPRTCVSLSNATASTEHRLYCLPYAQTSRGIRRQTRIASY